MKHIIKQIKLTCACVHTKYRTPLFVLMVMLTSACSDFLDTDSDTYLKTTNNSLVSPNDSVYSLLGILSEFQKLSDEIIIFGELQADLVDVSINADKYMKEINSHSISSDNPYIDISQYYAVINNCNYVIAHMDTLVGNHALMTDYTAAISIRAWTYLQLAKTFSSVRYYEEPVLSVTDARNMTKYPLLSREEVMYKIIDQLFPVINMPAPSRTFNEVPMEKMIPQPVSVLGECYLWLNNYESAAWLYKWLMEKGTTGKMLSSSYRITYGSIGYSSSWSNIFIPPRYNKDFLSQDTEVTTGIYYHPTLGQPFDASQIAYKYLVKPSCKAMEHWYAQENSNPNATTEFHKLVGDARGESSWSSTRKSDFENVSVVVPYITKFRTDTTSGGRLILERAPIYHLRYAEAVNRMGKPTLALAALNYGLKASIINNPNYVDTLEVTEEDKVNYIYNFNSTKYNENMGLRTRAGLKVIAFPTDDKALATLQDSILFVEDAILSEAALELAFEGNRWGDLVRIGLRRASEQQDFVAKKVSEKFKPNPAARVPFTPSADATVVYNKLLNQNNFFIPFPEK